MLKTLIDKLSSLTILKSFPYEVKGQNYSVVVKGKDNEGEDILELVSKIYWSKKFRTNIGAKIFIWKGCSPYRKDPRTLPRNYTDLGLLRKEDEGKTYVVDDAFLGIYWD